MKVIFKILVVFVVFIPILSNGQCDSLPNLNGEPSFGTVVESQPEFPGGDNARIAFINENIKWPKTWPIDSIYGKVFVVFLVDKNGEIKFPCILRSLDPILDSLALDAVMKMPKWIPAKQQGKPVEMVFSLPIKFGIDKKKKK